MANTLWEYADFRTWSCNSTACSMSDVYSDGRNEITYRGGNGYERYFVRVDNVPLNSDCEFTFKFCSPSGFTFGGYDGQRMDYAFVAPYTSESDIRNTGKGGEKVPNKVKSKNFNNNALSTPEEYSISFNSGSISSWFICFDFGYITDGRTITLIISDMNFDDGHKPLPDRPTAHDYTWTEANEFTWENFGTIPWGDSGLRSGFLLRSGTTIYTTKNGSVEALTETELTKELFKTYGTTVVPTSEQILSLVDPVLLLWDSDVEKVHTITTNMTAVPKPQTIYTDDFDMSDSSILGIEKVTATATDATVFAVSFDSGTTWKLWNGSEWATLSESDTGMSVTTLNAITTEQWNSIATTGRIQFRAVLTDNTATITSLVVDFLN